MKIMARSNSPLAMAIAILAWISTGCQAWDWKPAPGPLLTRWAEDIAEGKVHAEYPRPQLVREDWLNLNGLWDYAIRPREEGPPAQWDGKILVPFPVESSLSGVRKRVDEKSRLFYRRSFEIPGSWSGRRAILHFGAADWEAAVQVNGKEVGKHRGGYDSFSFDITEALKDSGPQELLVAVWDPTDAGTQPRGKQVRRPEGIWYTPATGIWRTVWLEPVPERSIASLRLVTDIDRSELLLAAGVKGPAGGAKIKAVALDGKAPVASLEGPASGGLALKIPNARLWSPDAPHLYDLEVSLIDSKSGAVVDQVRSYFGMRQVALGKDEKGITRILLNHKPIFQIGPLDQGFWPDGIYTAPTDEALKYDIEVTRQLGMNCARKHVKVEPDRWYTWCDRLGLLVWQDMPSGDRYIGGNDPDIQRTRESADQFELELKSIIEDLRNHPSIILWVPFNEGWGQFDTPRIVELIKRHDPTRLVDNASGWTDRGAGDVRDLHAYPGPAMPPLEEKRAAVLGVFGGLGLPIPGHTWQEEKNWGYRSFKSREELTAAYAGLIQNLRPLIERGLCAAIYTQTTDVEIEVNGLMTYDRALIKMDAARVQEANRRLFLPPPVVKTIIPDAQKEAQTWRYTEEKPSEAWAKPDFDDAAWKSGPAGFGEPSTPGAVVRTPWKTADLWIRRPFELPQGLEAENPHLSIHHDEDAEVYIDGRLAARLSGYTTGYLLAPLDEQALHLLKPGRHLLAIHCHQTGGGQYIDAGLVEVREQAAAGR